jgi:hypothetical protein
MLGAAAAAPARAFDAADGANVFNSVMGAYGLPTMKVQARSLRA